MDRNVIQWEWEQSVQGVSFFGRGIHTFRLIDTVTQSWLSIGKVWSDNRNFDQF